MIIISFVFLMLVVRVEAIICPIGQQPCESNGCYDPTVQGCAKDGTITQCINSCNGTCYSNSQYCYNNTKVCNNGELICDVNIQNYISLFPLGLTCYNSSQLNCFNNDLCYQNYSCGTQCLSNYSSVCVKNQTICLGFPYWNTNVNVCGNQQQCYDNTISVCLNGSIVCQGLNAQLCGTKCFTPDTQVCNNSNVQCINSCDGICYSNSQYCGYNNTKVCNKGELICDVNSENSLPWVPIGVTCYNSSQLNCFNNTLCSTHYSCGTQCLPDSNSVCVKNETICQGFSYSNTNVNLCGNQTQCYDNTTSVCLNGSIVCQGLNAQLCGTKCFTPDKQVCINSTVHCINSCNGTCYSNSQYCGYNNTKVCNKGELICDVKNENYFTWVPLGVTCYNSSLLTCFNNTLCDQYYSCGTQCLSDYNSACVNNQQLCPGFPFWNTNVNVCGSQQQCYDSSIHDCLGNSSTVCPIGNQLCSGVCYNPQSQYCTVGNNTISCLNNASLPGCPVNSTGSPVSGSQSIGIYYRWTIVLFYMTSLF